MGNRIPHMSNYSSSAALAIKSNSEWCVDRHLCALCAFSKVDFTLSTAHGAHENKDLYFSVAVTACESLAALYYSLCQGKCCWNIPNISSPAQPLLVKISEQRAFGGTLTTLLFLKGRYGDLQKFKRKTKKKKKEKVKPQSSKDLKDLQKIKPATEAGIFPREIKWDKLTEQENWDLEYCEYCCLAVTKLTFLWLKRELTTPCVIQGNFI